MLVIDYQDRRPIFEQIVERFQVLILRGVLEADEQMPSVRKLAGELSINPNTIQKAYSILEMQGYIYPVKGRGNFVSDKGSLLKQKKEEFWKEYRMIVVKGKEIGITSAEFKSMTEECLKGVYQ
ncbi:MAG: GntR family transcriptional regulator [Clostridia bacterium]|nr:GntR family transcriptional regulator [Clostridia bacterium]NCC43033.1 GntR family transcriptional regulator [Clostridia bacterium]